MLTKDKITQIFYLADDFCKEYSAKTASQKRLPIDEGKVKNIVCFGESKQYLQLGKCQSQDFDAQIAATTLSMLQYNLLAVSRRFSAYQTNGEMFR